VPDHDPSGMTHLDIAPGVGLPAQRPVPMMRRETGPDPDAVLTAQGEDPGPPPGRWSSHSRLVLGTATVVLACATAWHLGTVFLSNAPSNTISQPYQPEINAHVHPEFEQDWQLFAPNPLDENIAVEVRMQTLTVDGDRPRSAWINLTAQDISHIRGNPFPSHADQNLLRRAWDYYTNWHSQDDSSLGGDGPLSEEYIKRIALQRLGRDWHGNPITAIQIRSASTPVAGAAWTEARRPVTRYWTLRWWPVADNDYEDLGR
jgi:Family of unknown function (DUF5819)